MDRIPEILKEVHMYLKEKDLPLRGKAFGWMVVAIGFAIAFWLVCDALAKFE